MPKCETVSEKTGSSTSRMSCEIRLLDRKKQKAFDLRQLLN